MNPIVSNFMRLYHDRSDPLFARTQYMGLACLKCPMDMWIYQEIMVEKRPQLIVETGSFAGASALYLAHVFDNLGVDGRIVSVDIEYRERPQHPRITWILGSSSDPAIIEQVKWHTEDVTRCMVILDSHHSKEHVTNELRLLAPLVTLGQYLIVEDTNLNGHPIWPDWGPGPFEAVQEFLSTHPEFSADTTREKFMMTFNPQGYLLRHAT